MNISSNPGYDKSISLNPSQETVSKVPVRPGRMGGIKAAAEVNTPSAEKINATSLQTIHASNQPSTPAPVQAQDITQEVDDLIAWFENNPKSDNPELSQSLIDDMNELASEFELEETLQNELQDDYVAPESSSPAEQEVDTGSLDDLIDQYGPKTTTAAPQKAEDKEPAPPPTYKGKIKHTDKDLSGKELAMLKRPKHSKLAEKRAELAQKRADSPNVSKFSVRSLFSSIKTQLNGKKSLAKSQQAVKADTPAKAQTIVKAAAPAAPQPPATNGSKLAVLQHKAETLQKIVGQAIRDGKGVVYDPKSTQNPHVVPKPSDSQNKQTLEYLTSLANEAWSAVQAQPNDKNTFELTSAISKSLIELKKSVWGQSISLGSLGSAMGKLQGALTSSLALDDELQSLLSPKEGDVLTPKGLLAAKKKLEQAQSALDGSTEMNGLILKEIKDNIGSLDAKLGKLRKAITHNDDGTEKKPVDYVVGYILGAHQDPERSAWINKHPGLLFKESVGGDGKVTNEIIEGKILEKALDEMGKTNSPEILEQQLNGFLDFCEGMTAHYSYKTQNDMGEWISSMKESTFVYLSTKLLDANALLQKLMDSKETKRKVSSLQKRMNTINKKAKMKSAPLPSIPKATEETKSNQAHQLNIIFSYNSEDPQSRAVTTSLAKNVAADMRRTSQEVLRQISPEDYRSYAKDPSKVPSLKQLVNLQNSVICQIYENVVGKPPELLHTAAQARAMADFFMKVLDECINDNNYFMAFPFFTALNNAIFGRLDKQGVLSDEFKTKLAHYSATVFSPLSNFKAMQEDMRNNPSTSSQIPNALTFIQQNTGNEENSGIAKLDMFGKISDKVEQMQTSLNNNPVSTELSTSLFDFQAVYDNPTKLTVELTNILSQPLPT